MMLKGLNMSRGACLVAAALLLTGCSGSDEPAPTAGAERSDGGAGVAERSTEVIVEQTVADPESPADDVTIGIQSLMVEGTTMVLRLIVTPDFSSTSDSEEISLADAWGTGALRFGVTLRLLDRENLKEYSVIADTSGQRWASGANEVSSTNGEPMYAFAVFAAPEDDFDSVDVLLREVWPEFSDVPITR